MLYWIPSNHRKHWELQSYNMLMTSTITFLHRHWHATLSPRLESVFCILDIVSHSAKLKDTWTALPKALERHEQLIQLFTALHTTTPCWMMALGLIQKMLGPQTQTPHLLPENGANRCMWCVLPPSLNEMVTTALHMKGKHLQWHYHLAFGIPANSGAFTGSGVISNSCRGAINKIHFPPPEVLLRTEPV